MPTKAKPRRPRVVRKRSSKPKAKLSKPHKRLRFPRGKKLLLAPVVMMFPLAAYFLGFGGVGQHAAVQPAADLQYQADSVATASYGEEFTLDTFRYEVRGAVNRGRTYGFQKAQGRFIEVAISAENTGTAKATPNAIGLIDAAGTHYAQIPQFSLEGTMYSEILERGLEPGGTGTFFALFDVATSSAGPWVTFHARGGVVARLVWLGM